MNVKLNYSNFPLLVREDEKLWRLHSWQSLLRRFISGLIFLTEVWILLLRGQLRLTSHVPFINEPTLSQNIRFQPVTIIRPCFLFRERMDVAFLSSRRVLSRDFKNNFFVSFLKQCTLSCGRFFQNIFSLRNQQNGIVLKETKER
jgi:hypothetical protein